MIPYLIKLSTGDFIPLDQDELPNVIQGLRNKQIVVVRQGIFNPSHFVAVVKDRKRVLGENYQYGKDDYAPAPSKDKELPDIFSEVREKMQLRRAEDLRIENQTEQ